MKSELRILRISTYVEAIHPHVPGISDRSFKRAWAAAVILNPFAGQAKSDLKPFAELGEQLGDTLGRAAVVALSCLPQQCSSYGKGAIVGLGSDLEHGAAILHPKLGRPLRALLHQGKALIPSTIKHGAPGTRLDVPLHGTDDEWDFSLLDAIEVFVPGAPKSDEIVVAIALGVGGRAFARVEKGGVL